MLNLFLKPALLICLAGLPIWAAYRFIALKIQKRSFTTEQETLRFCLYLYMVCLAAITILPRRFSLFNPSDAPGLNLSPIRNTWRQLNDAIATQNQSMIWLAWENILGNIILFIPLGVLLPLISIRYRSFWKVTIIGLLCSAFIETIQWISRYYDVYRTTDIDDVILNTLGTMIGFGIATIYISTRRRTAVSRSSGY
jgi:glycopeptide antibiotics resistance protein